MGWIPGPAGVGEADEEPDVIGLFTLGCAGGTVAGVLPEGVAPGCDKILLS